MTSETVLESLQDMEFTRTLSPEQLEKLAGISLAVTFAEGQMLFHERDVGEFVYLIDEGQVATDIFVPGKGPVTVMTLGPGQLVGWSSLLLSENKTASAKAVTATRAIAINAAQLREMMDQDHDMSCVILWEVARVIAGRLRATRLHLLDIFAHTA